MFSICFLFLVSPFYVYFFIFCGLTHQPPPATRHPLTATRHPSTRHPPPVTRGKVLPCVKRFTCFDTFSINSLHVIRKDRNDIFNAASNFPTA